MPYLDNIYLNILNPDSFSYIDYKPQVDQYLETCERLGFRGVFVISPDDLEEVEDECGVPVFLGGGANGGVSLMRIKLTRTLVAVKSQYKNLDITEATENFVHELKVLLALQGLEQFPKIYGLTPPQDGGPLPAIVQEFIGDRQSYHTTSLLAAINSRRISRYQSVQVALDIAKALRDMHGRRLLHCDLKNDNILLQLTDKGHVAHDVDAKTFDASAPSYPANDAIKVKLIDFGLSSNMDEPGLYLHMNDEEQRTAFVRSFHLAPEVIRGQMPLYKLSEVFSLGQVFRDLGQLGDNFLDLLGNQCMKMNPDDRPELDDVINLVEGQLTRLQQLS
ncbi:hypothetical protein BSL78_11621 [Apostichopus japonicus]|uniref:Protein kinase domain-containing protein n=1 Tax=Stichopus japonicus TaxID=307972 RepID=A0A2G8KU23_STIJA|nr:hypothetical protein BSL78_11621 [Apostichopus japonicus]